MDFPDLLFDLEWFLVATVAVTEIEASFGSDWTSVDRSGFYTLIGSTIWSGMVVLKALLG